MGSRYLFIVLYVFLEHHLSRGDYRSGTTSGATPTDDGQLTGCFCSDQPAGSGYSGERGRGRSHGVGGRGTGADVEPDEALGFAVAAVPRAQVVVEPRRVDGIPARRSS